MDLHHKFYTCCDPDDIDAQLTMQLHEHEFSMWARYVSDDVWDADMFHYPILVATKTGTSAYIAGNNIHTLLFLDKLPAFKNWHTTTWALDMQHLRALLSPLFSLADETLPDVDAALVANLAPTHSHQQLPTTAGLKKLSLRIIEDIYGVDEAQDHVAEKEVRCVDIGAGLSEVTTVTDHVTAEIFTTALATIADQQDCSLEEAFKHFLTGTTSVSVHINLYTTDNTHFYIPGKGAVDTETADYYQQFVTHYRDLDSEESRISESYQTPHGMKRYLDLRDNQCRGPLCNRTLSHIERDHTVNHRDGGPTTARNLLSLCHRCHTLKGAGTWSYTLNPDNSVTWTLGGKTTLTTIPLHPTYMKGQTYAQHRKNHTKPPPPVGSQPRAKISS